MKDEAWVKTPNLYWHFHMNKPKFLPLVNIPLAQQGSPCWKHLCKESMSALETILLEPMICQRKILLEKPMEMVVIGNLFLVNLFPRLIREKIALRQAWTLRETGEEPSLIWFDAHCTPNPIMNILIWNCRGAMRPTFKKTVLDLVEWHNPAIFVITETRIYGNRVDDIIRRLPFDGAYSIETIGHANGIWLLWRFDIVSKDVLSATEQEIHVLV